MVRLVLITVIRVYRLVPCRVRRVWSFKSSTSYLALAAVRSASTAAEAVAAFVWFAGVQRTPNPASYHWRD
jgi:hypothetical protein